MPVPLIKKEVQDEATQTKVDLDPLMDCLAGMLCGREEFPIRTSDDVKNTLDIMELLANQLRELRVTAD